MNAATNDVEIIDPAGSVAAAFSGAKGDGGRGISAAIEGRRMRPR